MKNFGLLLWLTIISGKTHAQHCPFDGASVIVIQLKNKAGRPVNDSLIKISLTEMPNNYADSCTYATGLLSLPFTAIEKGWMEKYGTGWKNSATHLLKATGFTSVKGYRVVVLNQAQSNCMIKDGNDFIYRERNYNIEVVQSTGNKQSIPVPADRIYKLCTASGKWSRIQAIEIIVK